MASFAFMRRASLFLMAFFLSVCASAASLTTTFNAGNNQRGSMFDVDAKKAIAITQLDLHPMANTTYEIYYRPGTWVDHQASADGWTLWQTGDLQVQPGGNGTPVVLDEPIILQAAQKYAFYITSTITTNSLYYSNANNEGIYSENEDLAIYTGSGLEYPFTNGTTTVFRPRTWNGTIHYGVIGEATQFAIETPSTATQGQAANITVQALDISGYPTADYSGVVHFSSTDANAELPADVALVNGVGQFSATFYSTGTHRITATDTVDNTITGQSNDTQVDAAPVPDAPVITSVVAGNEAVTVSWSAPADNGSPITEYVVTGSPSGSCTTAALSCDISGLVNETAYTFTVVATNLGGDSQASAASAPATPSTDLSFGSTEPVIVLASGIVGATYNTPITVMGGLPPYTFTLIGDLPTGLALDANSGVISGTPSVVETANFSITVMDREATPPVPTFARAAAVHSVTQEFSITIAAAPIPSAATPVPTLGAFGLMALSSLMAMLGLTRSRKRTV